MQKNSCAHLRTNAAAQERTRQTASSALIDHQPHSSCLSSFYFPFMNIKYFNSFLVTLPVPVHLSLYLEEGALQHQIVPVEHKNINKAESPKSTKNLSLHRIKSFSIFPSPAGMSLTKLSLGGSNDVIYINYSRLRRVW